MKDIDTKKLLYKSISRVINFLKKNLRNTPKLSTLPNIAWLVYIKIGFLNPLTECMNLLCLLKKCYQNIM